MVIRAFMASRSWQLLGAAAVIALLSVWTLPISIGFSAPMALVTPQSPTATRRNTLNRLNAGLQPVTRPTNAPPEILVSFDCSFISLDARASSLLRDVAKELGWQGEIWAASGSPANVKPTFLDDVNSDAVRRIFLGAGPSGPRPHVAVPNGKNAEISIISHQTYLAGIGLSRSKPPVMVVQPDAAPSSGIELDLAPVVSQDGASIRTRITAKFQSLRRLPTIAFSDSPPGAELEIQRPQILTWHLETTLETPDSTTAMFIIQAPNATNPSNDPAAIVETILLLKPSIIITREYEERSFPGLYGSPR